MENIEFRKGDILSAETQAIVNPVNCVGVMGKGLALKFKVAYPENYETYREFCQQGKLKPGGIFVFWHGEDSKCIVNFATKDSWREKSQLSWVRSGLRNLQLIVEEFEVESIAIPKIGCGLGGLDWETVKKEILEFSSRVKRTKVKVYV